MAEGTEFFVRFVVAAAVGALIGIEREHRDSRFPVIAGVRTFPLISISGFLVAILAQEADAPLAIAAGIVGAFGFALMFIHMRTRLDIPGVTTPIAMVVTFLLGVVVAYGLVLEAVVVGVVATFLLVTKTRLRAFAQYLDDAELLSALQFITVAFILLPLTVDLRPGAFGVGWIGRGALVDPYVILLVVVLVGAISFASLVAMRYVGASRGLGFSGMLGGLVNSEASTAGLAHRAKADTRLVQAAVVGTILASTTMLLRNLAIAAFADASLRLATAMLPYLIPIAIIGAVLAWNRRPRDEVITEPLRVKNPFAVGPALRFAALFALVSLAADLAQRTLGDVGVYATAIGGFVSAGAVVAGLANLVVTGTLSLDVALRTTLLATAASVASKLVILHAIHPDTARRARTPFTVFTLAALVATAASFIATTP